MEDAWKRISGELVWWPAAYCCLVTEVLKMMKFLYSGFETYELPPVTLKSCTLNPGQNFQKFTK